MAADECDVLCSLVIGLPKSNQQTSSSSCGSSNNNSSALASLLSTSCKSKCELASKETQQQHKVFGVIINARRLVSDWRLESRTGLTAPIEHYGSPLHSHMVHHESWSASKLLKG